MKRERAHRSLDFGRRISLGGEQDSAGVDMTPSSRQMDRCALSARQRVHLCAIVNQELDKVAVSVARCEVNRVEAKLFLSLLSGSE